MAELSTTITPWLFVIIGTTGSGKTKLSVDLAEALRRNANINSEIVSADSMQIYKHIDVLSAKATVEEQARVKHHLLSIVDVDNSTFNVTTYQRMAKEIISAQLELSNPFHAPILVGGTNYYIESVIWDSKYVFNMTDGELDSNLKTELDELSDEALHARLASVDVVRAELLHPKARRKVLRSLKIYYISKKPHSKWIEEQQGNTSFSFSKTCFFWVSCSKDTLDERLERRVDDMVSNGLRDELRHVADVFKDKKDVIDWQRGALQSIGLREFKSWMESYHTTGIDDLQLFDSALTEVKTHSKQYARKQISWIKNDILPATMVFRFDSTDPEKWLKQVCQPAVNIAMLLLNGGSLEQAHELMEQQSPGIVEVLVPGAPKRAAPWKKHYCEFCKRTLNGDNEWQSHQKARGHKLAKGKFFKQQAKSAANPSASSSNTTS
jgi:tRNA dimethylallyltransferase